MLWKRLIGVAGAFGLAATASFALAAPAQAAQDDGDILDDLLHHRNADGATVKFKDRCEELKVEIKAGDTSRGWRVLVDGKVFAPKGFSKGDVPKSEPSWPLWVGGSNDQDKQTVKVPAKKAEHDTVKVQWWTDKHSNWRENSTEHEWKRPDHCDKPVEPKKPDHRHATCKKQGSIDIPKTRGVQYRIDGEKVDHGKHRVKPGKHKVTAEPKKGFKLKKDVRDKWPIKIEEPKDCSGKGGGDKKDDDKKKDDKKKDDKKKDDELPVTGTATGAAAGSALGLLALGGGLTFLARRRRIKFTA